MHFAAASAAALTTQPGAVTARDVRAAAHGIQCRAVAHVRHAVQHPFTNLRVDEARVRPGREVAEVSDHAARVVLCGFHPDGARAVRILLPLHFGDGDIDLGRDRAVVYAHGAATRSEERRV